jgi:hypothetical protein
MWSAASVIVGGLSASAAKPKLRAIDARVGGPARPPRGLSHAGKPHPLAWRDSGADHILAFCLGLRHATLLSSRSSFAGNVSGIAKEHVGRISDRGNPPFHSADRAAYAKLTRPIRCLGFGTSK